MLRVSARIGKKTNCITSIRRLAWPGGPPHTPQHGKARHSPSDLSRPAPAAAGHACLRASRLHRRRWLPRPAFTRSGKRPLLVLPRPCARIQRELGFLPGDVRRRCRALYPQQCHLAAADLGLLSEVGLGPEARAQRKRKAEEQRVSPDSPEGRYIAALAILDLKPGATEKEIKARYKELAKRHHPDRNGGDRAAEERLKEINQAYTVLVARPAV
jgi:hypothetical protein